MGTRLATDAAYDFLNWKDFSPYAVFREVDASAEGVNRLYMDEGGKQIRLSRAVEKCNDDEEIFWGCCYKKCEDMSKELGYDSKYNTRCSFNSCGIDKDCGMLSTWV